MPDPLVIQVMRGFKADLLRSESATMREMATRWIAVERRLSGQIDALALQMTEIAREGGTVSQELLFNEVRYQRLLAQLTKELDRYSDYAERQISGWQRQLARQGILHGEQAILVQGVRAGFNRLPVEAVEHMIGLAGNRSPLRALLVASWPDAAQGLTQALVNGVALGYNPRKTAREMARGSTRSLNRMMTISRTEGLRVYRQANLESYRASGVVTGYRRLAARDSRTCLACLVRDGELIDINDAMDEHPSGRCTSVPIVDGVPSPKWLVGKDWFLEQPQKTQVEVMGQGRFDLWQTGRFDLEEMIRVIPNPVWGNSLGPIPLRELGGRASLLGA